MAYIETWARQEMTKPVKVQYLGGNLFSQDSQGNLLGIELYKDGVAYSGGGTVSGTVIRADGGTVAVTGSISGNKAQIILPAAAYAVVGAVTIIIKLTQGGQTATIGAFVSMVYATSTDTIVDPGTIIPSIADLIAQIQAAVGSIPADYSALNQEVDDLKSALAQRGIPSGGAPGQSLRKKSGSNYDMEWADVGLPTDEQTAAAVNDWLDEHPEATTTVQNGAITKDKLNDGLIARSFPPYDFTVEHSVSKNTWQSGLISNHYVEGVCYDTMRGRYVIGCSPKNSNYQSKLIAINTFDFDNCSVLVSVDGDYGHCNDIKYNPDDDGIYIASGTGDIYVVDAGTLQLRRTISLSNYSCWQLSILPNGKFFVNDYSESRIYDSSFESYTVLSRNDLQNISDFYGIPNTRVYGQGSFYYDGNVYQIYNAANLYGYGFYVSIIAVFQDNAVVYARKVNSLFETESATVVGSKLNILLGNDYIGNGGLNFLSPENVKTDVPFSIPKNTALNDLKKFGVYQSQNGERSATLTDIPDACKTTGFLLTVERMGLQSIRQTIYRSYFWGVNQIYTRGYDYNSNVWSDWYRLKMVSDNSNETDVYTSIPQNADMDDYTTVGTFYSESATISATLSHIPSACVEAGFTLEVIRQALGRVRQFIMPTLINEKHQCFTRIVNYDAGATTPWVALEGKAEPDNTTSYRVEWHGSGYITNGTKDIEFSIPLGESAIAVTAMYLRVRQSGNYVVGSSSGRENIVASSDYTITATHGGNGIYNFIVRKNAALSNGVNNDTAGIEIVINYTRVS